MTDAEGRDRVKAEVFDFGLMVQTIAPKSERMDGDRLDSKEPIERFTVLDGLRKYAGEHVLLVGRPGSGKSTALARLLLEEAEKDDRIPVLVELRYWTEAGVLGLIQSFLRSLPTQVGLTPVEVDRTTLEELLRSNRFLLLVDGLNELPSEVARQDVLRFRREFSRVAIVFTTRDLSLGGDFGIEKRLEMQPLTETQMRSFVSAYVPEQSEAMLRQLGTRLREFGSTPLLLWMLCGLFRQTGEIPANLGGVFRAFTTGYERNLKADVVAEIDRRWWAGLLQALAARMMIGDGSVEFRVAIDRAEVEAIFTEFLRDRESLAAGAARKGLEDLLRHHLIQANGSQVEFRHQLIQEYYAAEWLLGRVGGLDDATLQQEFLNYLKWTEPVALMLALVDDEGLAVRVVELALDVDLMLGARLAEEVQLAFQSARLFICNVPEILNKIKTDLINPPSLLLNYLKLRATRSETYSSILIKISQEINKLYDLDLFEKSINQHQLQEDKKSETTTIYNINGNVENISAIEGGISSQVLVGNKHISPRKSDINNLLMAQLTQTSDDISRANIIEALGDIGEKDLIPALIPFSNHIDPHVRFCAVEALGKISGSEIIPLLIKCLEDSDYNVRLAATTALGKTGDLSAETALINVLDDRNLSVRASAAKALANLKKISDISSTSIHLNDLADRLSREGYDKNEAQSIILDELSNKVIVNRNFRQKMISALKAGGIEALKSSLPIAAATVISLMGEIDSND